MDPSPANTPGHGRLLRLDERELRPGGQSASVSTFLVDGKDAVVLGHVSQRLKSNGKAFTIPFALHLTVSGGLISRYHVYEDSLTVAEAVTA